MPHLLCTEMCRNLAFNWTWRQWRTMPLKRKLECDYWQLLVCNTWLPLFISVFVELRAKLIMSASAKGSLCFWMRLCLVSTVPLPHISNTRLWVIFLSHPCVALCLSVWISFFLPPLPSLPSLPLSSSSLSNSVFPSSSFGLSSSAGIKEVHNLK